MDQLLRLAADKGSDSVGFSAKHREYFLLKLIKIRLYRPFDNTHIARPVGNLYNHRSLADSVNPTGKCSNFDSVSSRA